MVYMKAIITGASSGIGKDMARYLSGLGYDLVLVARREEALKELKNELSTNVEVVPLDLQKKENLFFIHLNTPQKGILAIALAHDIPQLVHHLPYWLIALVAELALHLAGGERVLGGGQQVDCLEPVHKGQLAVVHHCVCRQSGLMPTFGATPALVVAVPIVLAATALLAYNAGLLSLSLEIRLAGGLVGETLGKFK